jgi:adenylate cyclase
MWESFWSDVAQDCGKGLLAAGASLTIQCLAPRLGQFLKQLRAKWSTHAVGRPDKTSPAPRLERRLAAIFATDVVGYSRLTEADEEDTHTRLKACWKEVIDPTIQSYRGRIVKNTGDGALIEFGSVVDAVRCAIEVQQVMAMRNTTVSQDRRIEFRVGVNLGDVIVESDDIYGDGVNVAARLESLALPGGICVSADAWHCIRGKVAAHVVDLGEHRLKNLKEPAHVYAIPPAIEMT